MSANTMKVQAVKGFKEEVIKISNFLTASVGMETEENITEHLVIWLCGQVPDKHIEKEMNVCFHELLRLVADNNVILKSKFKDKEFFKKKFDEFNNIEKIPTEESERIKWLDSTATNQETKKSESTETEKKKSGSTETDNQKEDTFQCVIVMGADDECKDFINQKIQESVPVLFIEQSDGRKKSSFQRQFLDDGNKEKSEFVHSMNPAYKSQDIAKAILKAIAKAINKKMKNTETNEIGGKPKVKDQDEKDRFILLCLSMDHFHIAVKAKLLSKAIAARGEGKTPDSTEMNRWKLQLTETADETYIENPNPEKKKPDSTKTEKKKSDQTEKNRSNKIENKRSSLMVNRWKLQLKDYADETQDENLNPEEKKSDPTKTNRSDMIEDKLSSLMMIKWKLQLTDNSDEPLNENLNADKKKPDSTKTEKKKPESTENERKESDLTKPAFGKLRQEAAKQLLELLDIENGLHGDTYMETFFVVALLTNQIKSAKALWYFVKNPLTAALVARGILQSGFVKDDESKLQEDMKCFERLADEFVGRCYKRHPDTTFSLLRKSSPVWGSTDSVELALYTKNRKFLSRPALVDYNRRLWFFGTTEVGGDELAMINTDSIIIWLRVIFKFLLPRIRKSNEWSFTNFFTPMCQFSVDTIGLLFNLIIYAGILMYQLKAADIHWTEYLFCAYIIPLLFEESRQIYANRMKYFKSVKNWFDISAVVLFLVAFSLRLAAYMDPQNTDLMGWTRIFYSLDFIAFSFLMFEKCYASDFLGPLLATISEMTVTLFKFLLILGVVFAAFAVASESVMYPNYDLKIQHIYSMSQRAFYNMFGEFSLDTFQRNGCTNDPALYNSNTQDRCVTAHAVYFVPILLAFFVFIVNILLFNLLIASFNSKITQIELKSMEVWHTQLCQLTIEYTGRHILPIPFLIYSFYQMCSCTCGGSDEKSKSKGGLEEREQFEEQEMLKFKRELDFEKRLSKLRKRARRMGMSPDDSRNGVTQNFYFMNGLEADDHHSDNDGFFNMLESWDYHEAEETGGTNDDSGADSSITNVSGLDSLTSMLPDHQLSIEPREDITSSLSSRIVRSLRAELKESDILAVCKEIRAMLRRRGNLSGAAPLHRPGAQNITIPQEFARTVADQVTRQLRSLIHELMDRNEDASLSPYVNIDSRFDREAATVILRNSTRRASGVGTSPAKGAKAKNEFYVVRRRSRYGLNWQWYDVGNGAGEPKRPNGKRDADEPEQPTGS